MTSLFAWIGSQERKTLFQLFQAFSTLAEDQFDLISSVWMVRNVPFSRSGLGA